MNVLKCMVVRTLALLLCLAPQILCSQPVSAAQQPADTSYSAVARDANSCLWERTTYEPAPNGEWFPQVHTVKEIATGLNYLGPSGDWTEAVEEFGSATNGGWDAVQGQHQAFLPYDIYGGSIQVVTPDGQQLQSRPIGIAYYDGTNGVLLAELTNSIGQQLLANNQVIYTNAFVAAAGTPVTADVLCTYRKGGFECDLVLRTQLPVPESFGLNSANTRLELLTEFFNAPQPTQTPALGDPVNGIPDTSLTFGSMTMGQGAAFAVNTSSATTPPAIPDPNQIPVCKTWTQISGQTILIEQVAFESIAADLETLPAPSAGNNEVSMNSLRFKVAGFPALPPHRVAQTPASKHVRLAKADFKKKPGLVVDYDLVNTSETNLTLQGDTTYFVSAPVTIQNLTIEGGAVVKYTNNSGGSLSITANSINCMTGPYRPAVFTAKDDDSIGEIITNSTGSPSGQYASAALTVNSTNSTFLHDLRILYTGTYGLSYNASSATNLVRDVQIVNFDFGISGSTTVNLENVLLSGGFTAIAVNGSAVNVTVNSCEYLSTGPFVYTNSILANLTHFILEFGSSSGLNNGFYKTPGNFGSSTYTNYSTPFQTAAGGNYYLTNGCNFLNVGTTNIDPTLVADLGQKTVDGPTVYTNSTFWTSTTFSPTVQRDANVAALGYHYDPLDYVFGGVISNANLTFNAGTAVGWYRTSSGFRPTVGSALMGFGINMANSAVASFQGTVTAPDYWVRCNTVQEQDTSGGEGPGGLTGSDDQNNEDISLSPLLQMDFTKCYMMAGDGGCIFRDDFGYLVVQADNCEFYSGNMGGYVISCYFTNCLWDRAEGGQVQGWPGDEWIMRNCTFHGGELYMSRTTNNASIPVSVRDCSFDGTSFSLVDAYSSEPNLTDYNYDAYTNASNPFPLTSTNNVVVTNFNWQTSWLGSYYLPTNSPLTNAGDVAAGQVGLYYFTTHTNQLMQSNSIVDIGYHHVATGTNGLPIDSNDDGIPDYWAAQYGLDPDASPTNVDGAYGDSDGDGLSNLQKYQLGINPLEYDGFANPIALPPVGSRYLRIITPTLLELVRITSGDDTWNFGNSPPGTNMFLVVTNGETATNTIQQVGFKRHPIYNSYPNTNDLRVENDLYLTLGNPLNTNAVVQVQPQGTWSPLPLDWPSNYQFVAVNDPSRYGPAIHVNQEGYPIHVTEGGTSVAAPQTAIIGYYCGSLAAPAVPVGTSTGVTASYGNTNIQTWSNTYDNGPVNLATGYGIAYPNIILPAQPTSDVTGWVGVEFTVGATNMNVARLGRWVIRGNSQTHTVKISQVVGSSLQDVTNGSVTISTSNAIPDQFAWVSLTNPVMLTAGRTYCVLSSETNGDDQWYFQSQGYTDGTGQIDFSAIQNSSVHLVDVASGSLMSGFNPTVSPTIDNNGVDSSQYQGLLQINLGGFSTPGEYQLQVDGLGASFPFWIGDEVPMKFARTYAAGLYNQRCGTGETIGTNKYQVNDLPFTRFTHGDCHSADAAVPIPDILPDTNTFSTAWTIIASDYGIKTNAFQKAEALTNPATSLFPFSHVVGDGKDNGHEIVNSVNEGLTNNTEGGHHDAGDYSKYTIDSAQFIHTLVFAADNFPNVAQLDNLGIPESGDGVSDVLQEAKWEADFLLKMQDLGTARDANNNAFTNSQGNPIPDGGFFTLVYPQDRQYEVDVTPDEGDPQIVWPKTTSVTAAAVGALAEIGSSPTFCREFGYSSNYNTPNWTNNPYLVASSNGWNFLIRACTNTTYRWRVAGTTGKDNCYQSLYQYGDIFMHNDELAWAAAAMFAAGYSNTNTDQDPDTLLQTGGSSGEAWYPYPQQSTNIPYTYSCISTNSNPPCQSWYSGWQAMYEGYGCAVRDYAFAVSSGRKKLSQLSEADTNYLAACQSAAVAWGHFVRTNAENNAYGTDLNITDQDPGGFGWYPNEYFPVDTAFDIAVADQFDTSTSDHSENMAAILGSLNFEAGCNPNNVGFLAGLGWRRQRVCVNQYWYNAGHILPPTGIGFGAVNYLQNDPSTYPAQPTSTVQGYFYPATEDDTSGYPLYDRWADAQASKGEYVSVYGARSLATMAWLAAQSSTNLNQSWSEANITNAAGSLSGSFAELPLNSQQTVQLSSSLPLSDATIVWDAPGSQQPVLLGPTSYTFIPNQLGFFSLQAEAALPDGRRVFTSTNVLVYDSINGGTNYVPDANTLALYHFNHFSVTNGDEEFPNPIPDDSGNYPENPPDLTINGTVIPSQNVGWMLNPNLSTDRAAQFNGLGSTGLGEYLMATIPGPASTPITIDLRIYPQSYEAPESYSFAYVCLLQQNNNSGTYASIDIPEGAAAPEISVSYASLMTSATWQNTISPNTWHQIRITIDTNQTATVYVDNGTNKIVTTASSWQNSGTNWTLTLGNFVGELDEVRISDIDRGTNLNQ